MIWFDKITDIITKLSRISPKNNSEKVESETKNIGFDRKIPKQRHISTQKRQNVNDLRLI